MSTAPVTLTGNRVRLEPLYLGHVSALAAVGLNPELWIWVPTPVTTIVEMQAYVETALDEQHRRIAVPFVVVDRASDTVIGSTRYANISEIDRRLEIGWTWITPPFQRTAANTECKFLLLEHAFERLGCVRVEFKTDALNEQSRKALLRIGAVEEGTFRKHRLTSSGRIRDTVYFSILDTEWPAIKAKLLALLG